MRKLLLADDSVTIQRVIELTFSGEDIQVLAVNDGEQAIARIPAEQPDVVLADIGMPRKGGYDVAAFVKGRPDLAHIPVLLLAGAFEPVDQTRAEQVGADGVLIKPFEPRQVIERVKELLAAVRPTISAEALRRLSHELVGRRSAESAGVEPAADRRTPAPRQRPRRHATPQVQSLDDLFESLNQALTEPRHSRRLAPRPEPSRRRPYRRPSRRAVARAPHPGPPPRSRPIGVRAASDESTRATRQRILDALLSMRPRRAPFDAARSPSTSAATLDDYFDRLSAAFAHTARPIRRALPDPSTTSAACPQDRRPRAGVARRRAGADGRMRSRTAKATAIRSWEPCRALMARGSREQVRDGPTPRMARRRPPAGCAWRRRRPPQAIVDAVTERVLARLVPEVAESLRRLVQQEIARTHDDALTRRPARSGDTRPADYNGVGMSDTPASDPPARKARPRRARSQVERPTGKRTGTYRFDPHAGSRRRSSRSTRRRRP